MDSYTELREQVIDSLDPADDDYEAKLIKAASCFRSFDAALDPFLTEHGYTGASDDIPAKEDFIRRHFEAAGIKPPREIVKWYTEHQDVRRETAFEICFAFGLGLGETDDFFLRVFSRERSFDCHSMEEAVYYFCLRNRLPWSEAQRIIGCIPPVKPTKLADHNEVLFTGSIMKELDQMSGADQLIVYLTENRAQFCYNNATAFQQIRELWNELTEANGLLQRERNELLPPPEPKLDANGKPRRERRHTPKAMSSMEGLRAILQIEQKSMCDLNKGKPDKRSLAQALELLPKSTKDSFPDRQGIDLILRGEHVSYERVRKWLILLAFTKYWLRDALNRQSYDMMDFDCGMSVDAINQFLVEAGYMELYPGNTYDWIFLLACHTTAPLRTFRELWVNLLADTLDSCASANPNGSNHDVNCP